MRNEFKALLLLAGLVGALGCQTAKTRDRGTNALMDLNNDECDRMFDRDKACFSADKGKSGATYNR